MENLKFVKIAENIVKFMKNFIENYKIKNRIKKFEATKSKVAQFETKYLIAKIEELEDKLDNHDCHLSSNDGCECSKLLQEIKDLKERLHDEIISNETDDILLTHC